MTFTLFRPALLAAACLAAAAHAQTVTPPPLPPGSHMVRPEPGMDDSERKRHVRAHHHKFHHKKDVSRDDSVHGHESQIVQTRAPAAGGAARTGDAGASSGRSGPAVQGGAGTGPKREKTDKGASSYFYGNEKK